jgi:DNA-binding NarL/FixJ family response regulator
MKEITVLIADDHSLFREGLRMLLEREPDIRVVGEATDGAQILDLAEALEPDILLLDVQMPHNGLAVLPKIRDKSPKTKVLIVSGFDEEEFITTALEHGAKGYLLKTLTPADLVKAIRATHAGELWVERRVVTQVLEDLLQKVARLQRPFPENRKPLTGREQEVVKWAIQGMTNKEIAAQLGISEKTVKAHLSNIFGKLNVSRRLQLLLDQIVDRSQTE